jgi:hypothetical protein
VYRLRAGKGGHDGRLQVQRQEGAGYGIDYSFKGKRIRERVGPDKKESAE